MRSDIKFERLSLPTIRSNVKRTGVVTTETVGVFSPTVEKVTYYLRHTTTVSGEDKYVGYVLHEPLEGTCVPEDGLGPWSEWDPMDPPPPEPPPLDNCQALTWLITIGWLKVERLIGIRNGISNPILSQIPSLDFSLFTAPDHVKARELWFALQDLTLGSVVPGYKEITKYFRVQPLFSLGGTTCSGRPVIRSGGDSIDTYYSICFEDGTNEIVLSEDPLIIPFIIDAAPT